MLGCAFEVTINDEVIKFNTVEELNGFIENNKKRIEAALKGGQVLFSKNPGELNRQAETLSVLQAFIEAKAEIEVETQNEGVSKKLKYEKGQVGVSKLIETSEFMPGKPLIPKFDVDAFKRDLITRLKNEKKSADSDLSEDVAIAEAETEADLIIASWENIKAHGNYIHYLADLQFTNNYVNHSELRTAFENQYPGVEFKDEIYKKLFNHFVQLHAQIAELVGDTNIKLFSEVPIRYNNSDDLPDSNIVGISDLLVVDSKGKVHVFDYKTSYKHMAEWDRDKYKKYALQLAAYRQILRSHGLEVGTLGVIPFKMSSEDVNKSEITNLEFDQIVDLAHELHESGLSELNYWMERRLPALLNNVYTNEKINGDSVGKNHELFFGLHKDTEYEKRVETFLQYNTKKENGQAYFEDSDGKKVKLSGNSRFDNNLVADYLKRKDNDKRGRLNSMIQIIRSNTPKSTDTPEQAANKGYRNPFGGADRLNNTDYNTFARRAFKRYFHDDWEVMEFLPLLNEGIMTFRNKSSNVYEFLIITDEHLDKPVKLTKSDLLLGHHYTKYDLKENPNAPKATALNLNGIKILSFINDNPEIFRKGNASVGIIRGVNKRRGIQGADIDALVDSFGKLANKHKIPNQLAFVRKAKTADLVEMEIKRLISHADTHINLSKAQTKVLEHIQETMSDFTGAELLKNLINIYKDIYNSWGFDKFDDNNELHILAGHVGELINDIAYNPTKFTSEQMIKNGIKMLTERSTLYFTPSDMKNVSFDNSYWMSQKDEVTNNIARNMVINPIQVGMSQAQERFVSWNSSFSRPMFSKFYASMGVNVGSGDHVTKFTNLIEKNGDSYDKAFRFKNPDILDNGYLSSVERDFLKKYLREMNTWLYYDKTKGKSEIEKDAFFKSLGDTYYNIPLARRSGNSGTYTAVKSEDGVLKRFWNKTVKQYENLETQRQNLFTEQWDGYKKSVNSMLEYYNKFDLTKDEQLREESLIGRSLSEFEDNFEYLLSEIVYTAQRKEIFDIQLPIVNATLTAAMLYNNGYTTHEPTVAIKYGKSWVATTIFSDNLLEKHQEKYASIIGQSKKVLSYVKLGLTPLNFLRELTQGQFSNFIRIGAGVYGEDNPSISDYVKAVEIITKESPDFLKNITLTEELNHMYGMADMDRDRLPEKMKISKVGFSQATSRYLLATQTAPDYILRMSILLAKMLKDGSYDAHSVDKDGKLHYDWKKDKRFSEYAKGNTKHPQYKYQKALYNFIRNEINTEYMQTGGTNLIEEGDALPKAYSNKERESVKSFVNYIHGSYDHGDNILAKNTLLGMMFIQFRTWLFAKKRQYIFKRSDTTAIGSIAQAENEAGEKLWVKYVDGQAIEVTENTGDPVLIWKGTPMEGVFNSMWRTLEVLTTGDGNLKDRWKYLKNDGAIMGNWKMVLSDTAIWLLIAIAIKGAIDWGELEEESDLLHAVSWTLANSANDLSVIGNLKSLVDPETLFPIAGYAFDIKDTFFNVLTGDKQLTNAIVDEVAFLRQIDEMSGLLKVKED